MTFPTDADLALLAGHQARVRRLVRSLLGDEHAAEDIVQDAWVRTLQGGPREPRALGAWFGRVAERLAINARRGDLRRGDREALAGGEGPAGTGGAAPSSDEIAARLELQRRLMDALDLLAEPHRSLLRDHFLGEQSLAALARRDGVPESTLRSRLKRSQELLRQQLDASTGRAEGGAPGQWATVFAPLGLEPQLVPPSLLRPLPKALDPPAAAAGGGTATASFSSLALVILMKKTVLAAVALGAALLAGWRFSGVDGSGGSDLGPTAPVAAELAEGIVQVPSAQAPEVVAEIAEEDVERTAADPTLGADALGAPGASEARLFALMGTIRVDRTLTPPPPMDVSVWMRAGFGSDGEILHKQVVRSDAAGHFNLELDRPPGTVTLTARAELDGHLLVYAPERTVRAHETEGSMGLRFAPRSMVLHGVVCDATGAPAPGARVHWRDFSVPCDDAGRFELAVASTWVYRIHATCPGHGRASAVAEALPDEGRHRVDLALTVGLDIVGTVRDPGGHPVAGARVFTFHGGDFDATTDERGEYRIQGFSRTDREDLMVLARAEGYSLFQQGQEIPAEGDLRVDIVLARGARVSGQVVNNDAEPVPGAVVGIGRGRHDIGKLVTRTDDDGRFSIEDVTRDERSLWVVAEGYSDLTTSVLIPKEGAGPPDLLLELAEGRSIEGVVRDSAGEPLQGVHIAIRSEDEYVGGGVTTQEDGTFQLAHLPEGDLVAESYGTGWVRNDTPLAPDGTVEITMESSGVVRGRVIDGLTGAPVEAFRIRVIDALLEPGESRITGYSAVWLREGVSFQDVNGLWSFDDEEVPVGSVMGVEAWAPGYGPSAQLHVVVQPADSGEQLVMELWAPVTLSLRLTSRATGDPIRGTQVLLTQERQREEMDRSWGGTTDARGLLELEGVALGPIWVHLDGGGVSETTLGPFQLDARFGPSWTELVGAVAVQPGAQRGQELGLRLEAAVPGGGRGDR